MFKKYCSIENHSRSGYLDHLRLNGQAGGEWVVQEKAHGANFSFASADGEHWATAKRNSALAPDDVFYGHAALLERHRERLGALWRVLRKRYPNGGGQVTVYGELLGGHYRGVKDDGKSKRVQRGIDYAPDNRFYAFDIHVKGTEGAPVGYLGVDEANVLFEAHGFAFAKTRFRGTLDEALSQDNAFDSEIPALYGLEPLRDNMCEGVVIRPVDTRYDPRGSRVIIKHKNARWSDKKTVKRARRPPGPEMGPAGKALLHEAMAYATPARVPAAVSKIGEVTRQDFGRVVGAVGKDVYADFEADHGKALAALAESDRKLITKALGRQAVELVRAYWIAELPPE